MTSFMTSEATIGAPSSVNAPPLVQGGLLAIVRTPKSDETAMDPALVGLNGRISRRLPRMMPRPPFIAMYSALRGGTVSPSLRRTLRPGFVSQAPAAPPSASDVAAAMTRTRVLQRRHRRVGPELTLVSDSVRRRLSASAASNSAALVYRASGSRSHARSTTVRTAGGRSCRMAPTDVRRRQACAE
jgi:hypothetical protein